MDIKSYLRRGKEAIEDGELELAERYYQSVLEMAPNHPEALEGLENLKVAHARKGWGPIGRWTVFLWSKIMILCGKREKVLGKLRILFASNPTNALFAETYGAAAAAANQLQEASLAYKAVLKLQPNRVNSLRGLGDVLRRLDNTAEAVKCYQKLRQLRPNDDRIDHKLRDLMAQEYAQTGIPEDIKTARRQVEKEKSKRIRVPGTPDFTERLERLAEHCEKNPEDLDTKLEMAKHLRTGGQLLLAQRVLSEILDNSPSHEQARREQASLWRDSGDLHLSAGLYGQLVKEHPDDEVLRCEWLETGLREAESKGRTEQDPEVAAMRKEVFERRTALWTQHLVSHPEDMDVRLKLAHMFLDHGDIMEAIEQTQRLIQSPSWACRGFLFLGQCFRAQDKRELALTQFNKAVETSRNRGYTHIPGQDLKEAYYWLGVTMEELERIDEAREAYGQVYAADIGYKDIRERYERTTS